MKNTTKTIRRIGVRSMLLATALFSCDGARASVIAQEDFDYTNGSQLVGLTGGTGWTGAWQSAVPIDQSTIINSALQVGNGTTLTDDPNLISRNFTSYSGDTLYFKVTLTPTENYNIGDFFILWMDLNNTSTSHNYINMGFDIGGNVMVRYNNTSGNRISAGTAVAGTEYTMVVGLTKTGAFGTRYDSMSFWVNPSSGDLGAPVGTLTGDMVRTSFSWIGIRSVNTEGHDIFTLDNLMLATTWSDVVPAVPMDADGDGMDDSWESDNFGGTNVVNGGAQDDWDADGMINLNEFLAGTLPTNAASLLEMENAVPVAAGAVVQWQAVAGKNYALLHTASLTGSWSTNATGIAGVEPSCTYTAVVSGVDAFFKVVLEQ